MASEAATQDGADHPEARAAGYPVEEIAAAWRRERPGTPVSSIGIVTPIWRLAKLLGDDRRRVLSGAGMDPATLDLLSVLRRGGPPYTLTTRELGQRSMITAGAVSQRVARAERDGLVTRRPGEGRPRTVLVELTPAGHHLVESTVDRVLGREAELIEALAPAQQEQLAGLLRVLLQDVQHRLGDDRITQVGED
ncbi:MarR family winged helix-turn-helix transcriptional regulator [Streptomyces noursei]|uniref:MarR family transcriptional regulator n=1 Tax=Streptomyces noursei TaxID=1971 RepID=A0A059W588_STRNR|nr:MarR family transcriptional regulator [Streptomyces noursei]AKA03403.1 MarR family transcriptional regulator [Streptomyces noursei ZPM]EOT02610.1 MarR family transcriptional regulator [Streptomyces noursei CCRC 11814]EXU87896.1 MarR family transcriptional regulator [Streptomyces noursei PD-1]GCB90651.1 MarR family transcriptional regulator [Streptomyces noursei]